MCAPEQVQPDAGDCLADNDVPAPVKIYVINGRKRKGYRACDFVPMYVDRSRYGRRRPNPVNTSNLSEDIQDIPVHD